jgi:hypothetical protein
MSFLKMLYAECCYNISIIIMLSIFMPSVVVLIVIMLRVILGVFVLRVMLIVFMLNVILMIVTGNTKGDVSLFH